MEVDGKNMPRDQMYANLSAASRCYRGAILMSLVLCVLSRAPAWYIDSSLSIRLAFPLFVVDARGVNKLSKRENTGGWISISNMKCGVYFFFQILIT